jgi:hypothetical protein
MSIHELGISLEYGEGTKKGVRTEFYLKYPEQVTSTLKSNHLGNYYIFSPTRNYFIKYFNALQDLGSSHLPLLRSCYNCFLATQRKGARTSGGSTQRPNLAIRK